MVLNHNSNIYTLFYQMIITMCILKVTFIIYKIHRLCNIDIFFLDWVFIFKKENEYFDENAKENKKSIWRTIYIANAFQDLIKERYFSFRIIV